VRVGLSLSDEIDVFVKDTQRFNQKELSDMAFPQTPFSRQNTKD
jgi:hypothetical protein